MIEESAFAIRPNFRELWEIKNYVQFVYDSSDSVTFKLISSDTKSITGRQEEIYSCIGLFPPRAPLERSDLDAILAHSMDLTTQLKDGLISVIDEQKFIMTSDFAQKMLNIRERV